MQRNLLLFLSFFVLPLVYFSAPFKWKGNSNEKDFMAEISSYETISINGEDYKTDEVPSVTSHPGIYEEDAYEIILKDGTKIYFSANGYTLKDKK